MANLTCKQLEVGEIYYIYDPPERWAEFYKSSDFLYLHTDKNNEDYSAGRLNGTLPMNEYSVFTLLNKERSLEIDDCWDLRVMTASGGNIGWFKFYENDHDLGIYFRKAGIPENY